MSKHLSTLAALLFVVTAAGSAHAVTAKWCFKWQGIYDDSSTNQDYLNAPAGTASEISATYTYVKIEKYLGSLVWTTLWQGYLDGTACSPNVEVLAGKTYRFTQRMSLHRSLRVIDVHPDGEDWDGEIDKVVTTVTTASPMPVQSSYPAPIPPDSTNSRLMPALTKVLQSGNTLDIADDVDIDVSTWGSADIPGLTGLGCGSWCSSQGSNHYHICITNHWSESKFNIAHEVGHTAAIANDGPVWGDPWGSDGFYQFTVDHRCDCTLVGGYTHCPTSREFTGNGQREGFSHFIAAASYNNRTDSPPDGEFVFYKNLMEATLAHWSSFQTILEFPNADTGVTTAHPWFVPLNPSSDVKWIDSECTPSSGFQEHMGSEWDWLSFFWNLWTQGGTNKYSIDEINTVWDGIPDDQIAYDCCQAYDNDPGTDEYWIATDCVHTSASTCSGLYPEEFAVGKLWSADVANHGVTTGLDERVRALYGNTDPKTVHFENTGNNAGVTF
jgi:hypothetical protein